MIDSIINCKKIDEADCVIATASYSRTSSLGGGAENGGKEIIKCLKEDVEFLDRFTMTEPGYEYAIYHEDLKVSNRLLPEEMVKKISKRYKQLLEKNKVLVLLGGDHSVSIGAFDAISKKLNSKNITILQIDAHCDLRDDDSNSNPNQSCISRFSHACTMRRAHEMGFKIVQVGVRSYAKEEYDYLKKTNIKMFEWGKGLPPKISEIIKNIKNKDVYLSIDVDGIDPAHMPATGTPVPGGLEWYYTINLLLETVKKKNVIGFDIVEVAPKKGEFQTQFAAAQLCYSVIGSILQKKYKQNDIHSLS